MQSCAGSHLIQSALIRSILKSLYVGCLAFLRPQLDPLNPLAVFSLFDTIILPPIRARAPTIQPFPSPNAQGQSGQTKEANR